MKDKRTYSLTAKERKQKRNAVSDKSAAKNNANSQVGSDSEQAMLAAQKKSKNNAVVVGSIVAVAVALILVAILAPVIAFSVNPYRGYKNVIAKFDLSNGMKLEYVIEEDKYDTAATNFIFLAKNGYFDNTVFFDAQNGWLRFGGYDAQPMNNGSNSDYEHSKHRSYNYDYCSSFKAIPNSAFVYDGKDHILDKFNYKLRADTDGTKVSVLGQVGVLAYLYSDMSTEFEFAYEANATNNIERKVNGNTTTDELEATRVGYALNEATTNNLAKIAALAKPNTAISGGYLWKPPAPDIKIERVKVYNLSSSKWRNFDFITYMDGNDSSGNRRLSGWTGIGQ